MTYQGGCVSPMEDRMKGKVLRLTRVDVYHPWKTE